MTQEFDPKASYLAVKAHEKMIAYVGFDVQIAENGSSKEGIIKISSSQRHTAEAGLRSHLLWIQKTMQK